MKNGKSAFVFSNGCHECLLDAAVVQQFVQKKHGFALADDIIDAEVIILLGCAVMQTKEEQSRELIRVAYECKKPDSRLVVSGCIAKARPELAEQYGTKSCNGMVNDIEDLIGLKGEYSQYQANFPFRPPRDRKNDLLGVVAANARQKILTKSVQNGERFKEQLTRYFYTPFIAGLLRYKDFVESKIDVWNIDTYTIKISTGCRGNCSYCSIKNTRGRVRSKKLECVIEEFKTGLEMGYRSFAFIGTDIGDYGKDHGDDLLDLLTAVVQMPVHFNLRLRNVNPRWIVRAGEGFHNILRSGKIQYMESPIQSASNRLLHLMNRGYKAEDIIDAMRKIRSVCPSLFIKTQIIVGFPSESDEDFSESLDICGSGLFNYMDVYRYSDRPNTAASSFPGKLPHNLIMKRYRKLFFRSLFRLNYRKILRDGH